MQLGIDDLLCPTCRGYVHPFLERCPACGSARRGRLADVVAGAALGIAALLADGATRDDVRQVALFYATRTFGTPADELDAAFPIVAGSLAYRAVVAADGPSEAVPSGRAEVDPAALGLVAGTLMLRPRAGGSAVAAIPLASVVAATPSEKGRPGPAEWAGLVVGERRRLAQRPDVAGDLLVTYSTVDGTGMLGIANRPGFLAPKARPGHYQLLARWTGLLAAAAAEARWTEIGPTAYAAEIGLADAPVASGARAGTAPGSGAVVEPAAAGIGAALEELERLRSARLVTDEEYAAKRREILARL